MGGKTEDQIVREKRRLRSQARRRREESIDREAEERLARLFTGSPLFEGAESVFATVSYGSELDTEPVIRAALDGGKELYLPVCDEGSHRMVPVRLRRYPDGLAPGAYGIPEPLDKSEHLSPPYGMGIILVPGLAFSKGFERLGQGGGYYDRFLPAASAVRVALSLEGDLLESIPMEGTDQEVDVIITDRLTRVNPSRESQERLRILLESKHNPKIM